jgi:hypothetical protein
MNTERALIVHTAFVKECVKVGRSVVEELKEAIKNDEEISDKRLEELFTPLIEFVETEADTRISRETDEIRAKLKEEQEQTEKEDTVNYIRNELDDSFAVNVNDKRKFHYTSRVTKRLKQGVCDEKVKALFPEFENATVADAPPVKDPASLIDDPELLDKDFDSEYWWDYSPQVNITIPPPGHKLVSGKVKSLLNYFNRKGTQFATMQEYIPYCNAQQTTFDGRFPSIKLLEWAQICDKALKGEALQPAELHNLLSCHDYCISNLKSTMIPVLEHHRKLE